MLKAATHHSNELSEAKVAQAVTVFGGTNNPMEVEDIVVSDEASNLESFTLRTTLPDEETSWL